MLEERFEIKMISSSFVSIRVLCTTKLSTLGRIVYSLSQFVTGADFSNTRKPRRLHQQSMYQKQTVPLTKLLITSRRTDSISGR